MKNTLNDTFIFIPDISGFSRFVNETAIRHSKHIISELLELIIDADGLNLEVSEIEGDSVLFFKNEIPKPNEILAQVEKTFIRFHEHLNRYDTERICRCGACETAHKLSLKFIVHQGPVEHIKIKNHLKLHGSDVILAHRLLKNSIPASEYVLFSDQFRRQLSAAADNHRADAWIREFSAGEDTIDEHLVGYDYLLLSPLFARIRSAEKPKLPLEGKKALNIEITINCPVDKLYEIFLDPDQRSEWAGGLQEIFKADDSLDTAGSVHTCVIDHKPMNIQALGRLEDEKQIIFAERINRFGMIKNMIRIYTFDKHDDHTHVKLEISFELQSPALKLLKPFFKQKIMKLSKTNLQRLKMFCEAKNEEMIVDKG